MSTPHISANKGEIAEIILLPGDPLRAKFIAENYLENTVCYSSVRNMLGFTGLYKGKRISVQGTGMGIPSISIYVNELINEYNCRKFIRIGTAGGLSPDVKVRDIILAMSASHDSNFNNIRFKGMTYCPTADFTLLNNAYKISLNMGLNPIVGPIISSDTFYNDDKKEYKIWSEYKVLAIEMEAAALYTYAAKYNRQALCICTISDSLVSYESISSQDRQLALKKMIEIALNSAIK